MTAQRQRSNVVIFADDQERWHSDVEKTQAKQLPMLRQMLTNCRIENAFNSRELFEHLENLVDDAKVEHVVVFLDLQFPTLQEGLEVLNRIKRNTNPKIRQVPVYVYSISEDPAEVSAVYARCGSGFYHKLEHPDTFWNALKYLDTTAAFLSPKMQFDGTVNPQPKNDVPIGYTIV